ncbi:hypothetical protein NMK71_00720 [Weeksellaceae bacterium KMM 9713]|uniref:Uncharacterized protein n=1 Tax=Profundicola chukchiensis TaxID=2961959 RepID=A0A9X4RUM9_9FLAO|nr:hypothetical protein [Profundicola chukchiensis]MDG4944925.1 hypothetical protein [Profundicola chukchiensis]
MRGQVNSKIDSMVFNLERDISSELGIKKSNSEKTNNLDQIYLDINVPWRLAQENQDSINFYLRKGDVENFRNYMLRLKNSTVEP